MDHPLPDACNSLHSIISLETGYDFEDKDVG